MHDLVVNKTKSLFEDVRLIFFSCDEVKTSYQYSQIFIHAYVVEDWQQTPMSLSVVDGTTSNNLKCELVDDMVLFGDLCQETIASKLIAFGANGVNVFQGIRTGVITVQLKEENAPFMISVHYMSHHINLVVQTLSKMGIVRKIEDVMQSLYAYFLHNPKITQKFVDLAHIVEIKVNEF